MVTYISWYILWSFALAAQSHFDTAGDSPYTFSQQNDGLHAECSNRQLTSLPNEWPADIIWLDLSHNRLERMGNLSHPHLNHLSHLDLSFNHINGILDNHTFSNLHDLRWLSLKNNKIQSLQVNSFQGLRQLTFLDLSDNRLRYNYDTFPTGVFKPLASLQTLRLHYNDDTWYGQHPDDVYRPLVSLRNLWIDAFPEPWCPSLRDHSLSSGNQGLSSEGQNSNNLSIQTECSQFGPGFASLKSLKQLRLGDGYSSLNYVSNITFAAFRRSRLEYIQVSGATLLDIDGCAFCFLPQMKTLRINSYHASLPRVLNSLYGLQNHSMTLIDLSGRSGDKVVEIDSQHTQYLLNICVKKLDCSDSRIFWVHPAALYRNGSRFVQCIEEIDVSENSLLGDPRTAHLLAIAFPQLRMVRLDGQRVYNVDLAGCILRQGMDCWDRTTTPDFLANVEFYVSPSLTYVNISSLGGRFGSLPLTVTLKTAANLRVLDISSCRMSGCHTTFVGLPKLETFVMSRNDCYNISESIFDDMLSLRHLVMSAVNLDRELFRTRGARMFCQLALLQTLDLSYNNLIHLDPNMLHAQEHLKELNLAGNRLQSLSVHLDWLGELELLDVSNNMLTTLLPHERKALDALADNHTLTVRLRGNPLLCSCSNLDLVHWLWSTRVRLDGEGVPGNYSCVTETGDMSDTASVMTQYDQHWRHCVGPGALGAASAAFLLHLLSLVTVYVVCRNWTHIVYVLKVMKRLRLPRRQTFVWDAYVGYADADWEWVYMTLTARLEEGHGVRLLLREREEVAGSLRAENIVQHIDGSWKILLIVTREFGLDDWACGFTVHQAQRSITDTMPDRVLVLFLEDPARLPPMVSLERLLRMVSERNVLHVRKNTPADDPVWERLAKNILDEESRRQLIG